MTTDAQIATSSGEDATEGDLSFASEFRERNEILVAEGMVRGTIEGVVACYLTG